MLPVVKGDRHTVKQICAYAVLTFIVTLIPFLLPEVGWIYAGTAIVLNVILLYLCLKLYKQVDRPRASSLFHYSMLYLAILFLMFAIDRTVVVKGRSASATDISVKFAPVLEGDHQGRQAIVKAASAAEATLARVRGEEKDITNGPDI